MTSVESEFSIKAGQTLKKRLVQFQSKSANTNSENEETLVIAEFLESFVTLPSPLI